MLGTQGYAREVISFRDWFIEWLSKCTDCEDCGECPVIDPSRVTTYASHGMYYYPARFIPPVVRFFINGYTKEGEWIIDPFAGSGTVGVEALLTNRNAICLDLNPVMEHLIRAKTHVPKKQPDISVYFDLDNAPVYKPKWSKIEEWYFPEFLEILKRLWGIFYENRDPLVEIALFRTSRKFSLADDQIPKIYRSRKKRKQIEELLKKGNHERTVLEFFEKSFRAIYRSSVEFKELYRGGECLAKGGIDIVNYGPQDIYRLRTGLKEELEKGTVHLLTSPPYGMAHEYIRSFKLELAWLGKSDAEIRNLSRLEIPYRSDEAIRRFEVHSDTYERYFRIIEERKPKLARVYETYFKSVLRVFETLGGMVTGYMGIFVGNATFSGIMPPYDVIFIEHLEEHGFKHVKTYVDVIKARKLFRNRRNASPNGIEAENLVILRAKR